MLEAPDDITSAAMIAHDQAYAPYSRFRVGAAVRDEAGRVHFGCNVENAAYPLGTCAEAGAIAEMVVNGGRKITEVAIAGRGSELVTPCGGCRQRLREFAGPETLIHICDETGKLRRTFTLAELLPASFGPENLVR